MMDLTEWAKEIQRLSKAIRGIEIQQTVSLCYTRNIDRNLGKNLSLSDWVWRVDVGFLIIDDFLGRDGYEGVREFSAETIEEAARAAIVALKKRLNQTIENRRKELRQLENEAKPPKTEN